MATIDVSAETFQAEVVERSSQLPVVVDFWAQWCGPCRTLGPLLEAEAAAREGKVVLAKVDTDANQPLARSFDIQGIPAVKAFRDGKVVDEFVGAAPPAQVRAFFDRLVPSRADELAHAGDETSLREALELAPGHPQATLALARLLHRDGRPDEADRLLSTLPGSFAAEGLQARIALEDASLPEVAPAFAALDADDPERAVELLLAALAEHREHADELRRAIVGILDVLGVEHPFAREARRRLAAALY